MGIRTDIIAQPKTQRAAYKADLLRRAVAALFKKGTYTFTSEGYTVTVSNPLLITNGLEITVAASYGGSPLTLNNPFRFINPPLLLRDEKGDYVENPAAAAKAMLIDAIRSVT